jgi:predicted Holliday junction resolvase-like endonuclease
MSEREKKEEEKKKKKESERDSTKDTICVILVALSSQSFPLWLDLRENAFDDVLLVPAPGCGDED